MPIDPFAFGFGSQEGRYGPDNGARIVNGYAQEAPAGSGTPFFIYCRPGLQSFSSPGGSGGFRGALKLDDSRGYVVVGTSVYRVAPGGSVTLVGSMPGTEPVWMARNKKTNPEIALCSDGLRYLITTGSAADSIASITDTDLAASVCVFYQGGYFVWLHADGSFQVSGLDNGANYDAADVATAEADPDGLNSGCPRGQEIILAGPNSVQFYLNDPDAGGFPYQPVLNTTLPIGCLAGQTLKTLNGVPIFVASDATVRMIDGYSPTRISTHEIEREIDSLTVAGKAALRAWTFTLEGHSFYVLSSATWTWVCDLLTRQWYDWRSYGDTRWNVEGFLELSGKRIVGALDATDLYTLSLTKQTDNGAHLVWKMISTQFGQFPYRMAADELYVNLVPGVGLLTGDDEDVTPEAMLRVSDDDGVSWSDQMLAPIGKRGDTHAETSFTGLGASGEDGFRFELSVSAAVARAWTGSAIRYTPLKP